MMSQIDGSVPGWILELDRGKGIPFEGNYSQWLEAKAKRLGSESRKQAALQKQIEGELEWVRSQAKGQQKKGKSRMRRYDELVQQVCSSPSSVAIFHRLDQESQGRLERFLQLAAQHVGIHICLEQQCADMTSRNKAAELSADTAILYKSE
jgi:ATPase subunit of ABC transporter with duplicated ATPase domains